MFSIVNILLFFILVFFVFFFFNDTATTEIYTLSLHDALPICTGLNEPSCAPWYSIWTGCRSEEHTSELQSRLHLVCRLLLEKKKKKQKHKHTRKKKKTKKKQKNTKTTT